MSMSTRRILSLGLLTLAFASFETACTDDAKKPEETVQPVAEAAAAEPSTELAPAPTADLSNDQVFFAFDESNLSSEGQATLNKVGDALKADAALKLTVEGHTDERGSTEYNLALGERRAQAVKNYLINLGIDGGRLSTVSLGEERPAMEGHDESAWAKNRRAVFVNISH